MGDPELLLFSCYHLSSVSVRVTGMHYCVQFYVVLKIKPMSLMHSCPLSYIRCLFNFYYHHLVKTGLLNSGPPAAASQSAEVTETDHGMQTLTIICSGCVFTTSSELVNNDQHSSTPEPLEIQASPCAHLCSKYGSPCASKALSLLPLGWGEGGVFARSRLA